MEQYPEPCLVLIGGRSGCGKTTVVEWLVSGFPSRYARVPSFKSRARWASESDVEYTFVRAGLGVLRGRRTHRCGETPSRTAEALRAKRQAFVGWRCEQ